MARRGRSRVDVKSRSRRNSSSRGGGERGVVPALVRSGVGTSRDSSSASPNPRRSSSRSGRRRGSNSRRRSSSGQGAGDVGDSSQRRRRRSRTAALPSELQQGQRLRQGGDAANPLRGGGASPRVSTSREESVAAAAATATATAPVSASAAGMADGVARMAGLGVSRGMSFRDAKNGMEDHEREALLSSLSAAYTQVNDLTHELKLSLDRLDRAKRLDGVNGTERDVRPLVSRDPQLLHNPIPPLGSAPKESPKDMDMEDAIAHRKRNALRKMTHEVLPRDEEYPLTPAAVRQLLVEAEGLRQRNAQASAKEEKNKLEISNMQRHIALLESMISKPAQDSAAAPSSGSCHTIANTTNDNISVSSSRGDGYRGSRSSSRHSCRSNSSTINNGSHSESTTLPPDGVYCSTPGGTRYQDKGDTKSLVARVVELEEKLKSSSAENAKAKQGQRSAKLKGKKLEMSLQRLKHDLVKSRAMNECLRKEVDRLQSLGPEDNPQGSGWQRQWLNGLKEPLSPEPTPIEVDAPKDGAYGSWRWLEASAPESNPIQASAGNSNTSSPVVLVGDLDLDKNNLVYTTDRSQFRRP